MSYELAYLDTCLPSYFNGSDIPYVQIVVDGSTTVKQAVEALHVAVRHDAISNDDGITEEQARAAINGWFESQYNGKDWEKTLIQPTLEVNPENYDGDFCYMYFGFLKED